MSFSIKKKMINLYLVAYVCVVTSYKIISTHVKIKMKSTIVDYCFPTLLGRGVIVLLTCYAVPRKIIALLNLYSFDRW
jgi:hypothetical protein